MKHERVIFRMEKDKYNARDNILACFPDEEANPGRIACTPFFFSGGEPIFEPHCEVDDVYYYTKTKSVKKASNVAIVCQMAIEKYYGCKFDVVLKRS